MGRAVEHLPRGQDVLGERLVRRGLGVHLVDRGPQAPPPIAAQPQPVLVGGPEAGAGVHLPAAQHQLDRTPGLPRGQGGDHHVRPAAQPAAEAAPDEGRHDSHRFPWQAEHRGEFGPRAHDPLRLVPHRETVAVPAGDRGERLHRMAMVARRPEGHVQPHRRRPQPALGIPAPVARRFIRFGRAQVRRGPLGVVADVGQARAVLRGLQGGGDDDGDRPAVEEDPIVLEDPQPPTGGFGNPALSRYGSLGASR